MNGVSGQHFIVGSIPDPNSPAICQCGIDLGKSGFWSTRNYDKTELARRCSYPGITVEYFLWLSNLLNFTFEVRTPLNGSYGKKLDDGSWDGLVGMVDRNEADVSWTSLFMLAERFSVIDYGPLMAQRAMYGFLYKNPSNNDDGMFSIFYPLNWSVYTAVGISFLLAFGSSLIVLSSLPRDKESAISIHKIARGKDSVTSTNQNQPTTSDRRITSGGNRDQVTSREIEGQLTSRETRDQLTPRAEEHKRSRDHITSRMKERIRESRDQVTSMVKEHTISRVHSVSQNVVHIVWHMFQMDASSMKHHFSLQVGVILFSWFLVAYTLCNAYRSNLIVSAMSVTNHLPIRNIHDATQLLLSNRLRLVTPKENLMEFYNVLEALPSVSTGYTTWAKLLTNYTPIVANNSLEMATYLSRPGYAYFGDVRSVTWLFVQDPPSQAVANLDVVLVKTAQGPDTGSLVFRKNFPYIQEFRAAMVLMMSDTMTREIEKKYFPERYQKAGAAGRFQDDDDYSVVAVTSLQTNVDAVGFWQLLHLFPLWAIGCGVSTLVFAIEKSRVKSGPLKKASEVIKAAKGSVRPIFRRVPVP